MATKLEPSDRHTAPVTSATRWWLGTAVVTHQNSASTGGMGGEPAVPLPPLADVPAEGAPPSTGTPTPPA
ncbi:MAG TPA: hypothetical protein VIM73_19410, partial [Polyangiaceae bacterium]